MGPDFRYLALTVVAILAASPRMAQASEAIPSENQAAAVPDAANVDFRWNQKIPLRDGVQLSANVYLPRSRKAPAPCIFTLTPYIAQSYHDRGIYFAAHGYPFLTVDVRGRGNSEGQYDPLLQEAHDGYDVVEWLAKQPYCNGKISMWGGSYAGYDQWAAAKEFPPHLATIVPVAAPYAGVDFPMRGNIFAPYDVQWLTFTSGHTSQDKIFGDGVFWSSKFRTWFESGAPFKDIDSQVGAPSTIFQRWVQHPRREPKLVATHAAQRYDFDSFTFVSRQIGKGSRLRLALSPINSIFSEKNYNASTPVSEQSMKDARPVTVTLFHDRAHPSALYVPFGQP